MLIAEKICRRDEEDFIKNTLGMSIKRAVALKVAATLFICVLGNSEVSNRYSIKLNLVNYRVPFSRQCYVPIDSHFIEIESKIIVFVDIIPSRKCVTCSCGILGLDY